MKINFKKESLFERFGLSTSLNKTDLLRTFQTRSELRKELPIFIQTINSEQNLFIDELFTTRISDKIYTVEKYLQYKKINSNSQNLTCEIEAQINISYRIKLATLVDFIRRFGEDISILKVSGKIFDELIESTQHFDIIKQDLNYANIFNAEELFLNFCESLWCEIENSLISSVKSQNSKTVNSSFRILSAISNAKLKNRFLSAFANDISNFIDSTSCRLIDKQVYLESVNYIYGLNCSLFKNNESYLSFKHYCVKLIEYLISDDEKILLLIPKLIERLKPTDVTVVLEKINNLCFQSIEFDNIEDNNYKKISSIANFSNDLLNKAEKQEIAIENDDGIKLLLGLSECGSEWYEKYLILIKNIKSKSNFSNSMYELCTMIYYAKSLKELHTIYFKILSNESGFDAQLALMVQKKERFESVCERTNNQGKYILYSTIKSQIEDEIPIPREIDNFILDYYALSILNQKIKKIFIVFQQIVFTPLIMIEHVPEIDFFNFGYNKLTPKGNFMKDLFMELPNDWEIDLGTSKLSVKEFLQKELDCYSGSNYGNSKSKSYMAKCDNVVSSKTASTPIEQMSIISNTLIPQKQNSSKTTSTPIEQTSIISSKPIPQKQDSTKQSEKYDGMIVCGVLGLIALIAMIVCYTNDKNVGALVFLILSIALFIGCAKYDYFAKNDKAQSTLIIVPIVLCIIFCPIIAERSSDNDTSWTNSSSDGSSESNSLDDGIVLTSTNFDDYFSLTTSCRLLGRSTEITYNIKPKKSSYAYDSNSSSSITVKIKISLYTSQYESYPVKSKYINVSLYKSSGYKKTDSEIIFLNNNYDVIYWNEKVTSCNGTIYE